MAAGRGVQRILDKLKRSIEDKNYYEAHQMYRTLYFRLNAQKKYAEVIKLLYDGALTLLEHEQYTSGADLSLLMIEVLRSSNTKLNEDLTDKIQHLHHDMTSDLPERSNFANSALHWSASLHKEYKSGHPMLHQKFAQTFWKERSYYLARYHYIHSSDGEACAAMLVEYNIMLGFPSEVDLFLAQAVFQFLCLRNKASAEVCFNCYTSKHPQVEKGPPYIRPLLNFLWLLLIAVDGGKLAVYTVLCEQYQPSLQRDPCYNDYLDRIGQLFFGVPPPKKTSGGIFDDIMQMFGGGDDETSATQGLPTSSNTSSATMEQEDLD